MRIFLAGATGAIGTRLSALLLRAGHAVSGTTRSATKAESLRAAARMAASGTERNARMRTQGTQHLIDAAVAAGVRRVIAQSIAWPYALGAKPHSENDPLDVRAEGVMRAFITSPTPATT